jgi:hypothetical protein
MNRADKILATILETVAHGKILPKHIVTQNTQSTIFEIDTMRNDIENDRRTASKCTKANDPELYKMITKSLAILTWFPHGKDVELENYSGETKRDLEQCLEKLWGKPITEPESHIIVNQ